MLKLGSIDPEKLYRATLSSLFSGRRRPDWQSKPGTEVAVASRQNSNIKIVVNSQKDGALEDYG